MPAKKRVAVISYNDGDGGVCGRHWGSSGRGAAGEGCLGEEREAFEEIGHPAGKAECRQGKATR